MSFSAQLLHSLSFDIHNQPTNVHNEISLCTKFIENYTEDVGIELAAKGVTQKLIESITSKRLGNLSWVASRPSRKWFHPLMRICRVLLREKNLVECFHDLRLHANFVQFCEFIVSQYLAHDASTELAQSISTLLNMLQKLCIKKEHVEMLVSSRVCKCVLDLLNSHDMSILQGALEVLGRLSDFSANCRAELCVSTAIDVCLQLAPSSDLLTQKLCVSLLRILSCEEQAREQIKIYDGISLLIGLLSVKNSRLQWHVAWALAQLAEDIETATEIATLGGVSLALSLLYVSKVPERGIADWIAMMTGVCALLAQLCQSDSVQLQIVNGNGIYVLGQILLLHLQSPTLLANSNYLTLQCSVFRVLRLLFSLERNRHYFKKVFASDFFAVFIDVGHYVHDLQAYNTLVEHYNAAISMKTVDETRADWDAVNLGRDPIGVVGEYELLEQLGAGAFGCVYTVRKRDSKHLGSAPQYFALKEIYMNAMQSDTDANKSFGDIISEVKIIKQQLRHPNIVRYRKIFVESHRLYIVMDLIEGASLKEHINSTKEKKEKFHEDRVWSITIQMILALRYLHKEKHIVHRDLKPNNIMLTDTDRVVITDFGLAKQKGADYLKSAAGTIIYSCPEVVQHLPYGEKADIWSFGCCLYEICCLRPAFYSQNMLQLATLIVESKYDPVDEYYSESLRSVVKSCLISNPVSRPDIDGIASTVAPRLILCLDEVFRKHSQLSSDITQHRMFLANEIRLHKRPPSSSLNSSTSTSSAANSSRLPVRRRKSMSAENPTSLPQKNGVANGTSKIKLPPIDGGNIDKPKRELKSLSAGTTSKSRVRLPLSSTLPSIVPAQPTNRRLTVAALRTHQRASSSGAIEKTDPLLTLRAGALRPTIDPVVQILAVVQKIFQITQSSVEGSALNYKKRLIEQFQRTLFGRPTNPGIAKRELRKLVLESTEEIPLELGFADFRPVLADLPLPPELSLDKKITRITYEQLSACIAILSRALRLD